MKSATISKSAIKKAVIEILKDPVILSSLQTQYQYPYPYDIATKDDIRALR